MHHRAKLLSGAALIAVTVLAGIAMQLLEPGIQGGPDRAAAELPQGVAALVWTAPLGDVLAGAREMGLTAEVLTGWSREFFNSSAQPDNSLLSAEGLTAVGIDIARAPTLVFTPGPHSAGLGVLYLPVLTGRSGTAVVREVAGRMLVDPIMFSEMVVRGHAVLWLEGIGDNPSAGAVVEVPGGCFLVFPWRYRDDHAGLISGEVSAFVERLLDPEVPRLADTPGYSAAVAGSGGSVLGLYLNPTVVRTHFSEDVEIAASLSLFQGLAATALYLTVQGNRATITGRAIGPEGGDSATFRRRDDAVFGLIPGEAGAGIHLALAAEHVAAVMEGSLALLGEAGDEYQAGKRAAAQALQLPAGAELHHLWDGEIGLFVADLSLSPELMLQNTVLFAGLSDLGRAKTAVRAAAQLAGEQHFAKEKSGSSPTWRIAYNGMVMGLMVHRGRLWFAGDLASLAAIEKGTFSDSTNEERTQLMTSDMREANGGALYVDLAAIVKNLPAVLDKQGLRSIEQFRPLLSDLDYLTAGAVVEGNVTTIRLTLTTVKESVGKLAAEAAADFIQNRLQ